MSVKVDKFAEALIESGVATSDTLTGCTTQEILSLEQSHGVSFPSSYRKFLERMGRGAGVLFDWDHVDVYYDEIHDINRSLAEYDCVLPTGGFVILGRLGEQFLFIVCNTSDECPVFWWGEGEDRVKKVYDGVLDWLEDWHSEAIDALNEGYFDD